jgi:hypothetical protein
MWRYTSAMLKLNLFFLLLLFVVGCAHSPERKPRTQTVKLFGAPFDFTTYSSESERVVQSKVDEIRKLQSEFDPDCYYKKDPCPALPDTPTTKEITQLSDDIKTETLGYFEVRVLKNGKLRRDFGGIAQGFVLNQIYQAQKSDWSGDFSGDIFIARGAQREWIGVADPRIPELDLAKIQMASGWVMGGTSPEYGDEFRNPIKGETVKKSDFVRLILVAKPEFDGGRLDAWETALMAGGKKLLDHLWILDKYAGQWGYYYVARDGSQICSPNLVCDLNPSTPPTRIKVVW